MIRFHFLVILLSLLCYTFAASLILINNNPGDLQPVAPVNAQQYRTHVDIIRDCLWTLFICTWVAVHPNVPPRGEGRIRTLWRRLKLMLWTLVAPELILLWAYRQWAAARLLAELFKDQEWTLAHGHFLIMGGFSLVRNGEETPLDYESFCASLRIRTIASSKWNEDEARPEKIAFPLITAAEINDKTRSDLLSKLIAGLQSMWFIVQCVARYRQGLALTEVELVTLASASLTGLMYFFWWDKPLGVQEPIKVYPVGENPPNRVIEGAGRLENYKASLAKQGTPLRRFFLRPFEQVWVSISQFVGSPPFSLPSSNFRPLSFSPKMLLREQHKKLVDSHGNHLLGVLYIPVYVVIVVPIMVLSQSLLAIATTTKIERNAPNIPMFYAPPTESSADSKTLLLFFLPILATFFGGLHLIAWDYHFPSVVEQLLWRICSSTITLIPSVILVVAVVTNIILTILRLLDGRFDFCARPLSISNNLKEMTAAVLRFLFLFVAASMFVAYMIARMLLLVDACLLLRNQPETAFYALDWSDFWPHF